MSAAIWQEVECGGYAADLRLWEELASGARGPVLDLGCGVGRVALHLARREHPVIGLDCDAELVAVLSESAGLLPVQAVRGDVRNFELEAEVALALAPMQLAQLLAGPPERLQCLRSVAAHLTPGGRIALAIVESMPESEGDLPPLPDVREVEGWIYSSLPLNATVEGEEIIIRRLRQTVSPAGDLSEEENEIRLRALVAGQLESEAAEVGLAPLGRHAIPSTDLHVGSTVVVLGREA